MGPCRSYEFTASVTLGRCINASSLADSQPERLAPLQPVLGLALRLENQGGGSSLPLYRYIGALSENSAFMQVRGPPPRIASRRHGIVGSSRMRFFRPRTSSPGRASRGCPAGTIRWVALGPARP